MGKRILNIIDIERGAHPVKSALSLAEEWLNHNPEHGVLYLYSSDDSSLVFTTVDWDTGCFIAEYISSQCKNVDVDLQRDGDYFERYYIQDAYYNGSLMTHKFYDVCNYKIQVPACLGYEEDVYETFTFIPERMGVDRKDVLAVATRILKSAIEEAPNETGGMLLQNDDCDAFKAALQTAVDSLVKYHDFDQYTHFDIQETSDSDTTTAPAISDNTEEEKFPF